MTEAEGVDVSIDELLRAHAHVLRAGGEEHNLLALLDAYHDRATQAESGRDEARRLAEYWRDRLAGEVGGMSAPLPWETEPPWERDEP